MCVLILNDRKSPSLSLSEFQDCYSFNPDGIGIAYATGGKLQTFKFLPSRENVKAVYSFYKKCRQNAESDLILHFRISTGGKVDINNVHPFKISEHSVLFHNGIIKGVKPTEKECDTWLLARFLSRVRGIDRMLRDKNFLSALADIVDEKMIIFSSNGTSYILNRHRFTEIGGNLYSNTHHKFCGNYGYRPVKTNWKSDIDTWETNYYKNKETKNERS